MAEQYYESPRTLMIEGQHVEITFARLSHKDKSDLRNFFQKYSLGTEGELEGIDLPAGGIEQLMIRRGLEKLVVGTKTITLDASNPVSSFPDLGMGDVEGELDLYDEVIKTGVDKNRFLGRKYPFNMVFAQYLGQVEADKEKAETAAAEKAADEGRKVEAPDERDEESVSADPLPQTPTSAPSLLSGSDMDTKAARA